MRKTVKKLFKIIFKHCNKLYYRNILSFKAPCFEKLSTEQPLSASYYDSNRFSNGRRKKSFFFNWNARNIRNKTE